MKTGRKPTIVRLSVPPNAKEVGDEDEEAEMIENENTFLETVITTMSIDATELSSSSASLSADPSYVVQQELLDMPNFLDELGGLPSIEDISDDDPTFTQKSMLKTTDAAEVDPHRDVGSFVDPLTGVAIEDEEVEEEEEEEMMVEEESEEVDLTLSEDSELLILLEMEKEEEPPKPKDDAEAFETFFELEEAKEEQIVEEFDWIEYERVQMARQLKEDTQIFLEQIIDNVVDKCEYIDPKVLLRRHLDKRCLMQEIDTKLRELEVEQKMRVLFNRKVVEYYYRKADFRCLAEDKPEHVVRDMRKFKEATEKLDAMMGREKTVRDATQNKIGKLEVELAHSEAQVQQNLNNLEELVRKTIIRDKLDRMPTIVNKELARMSVLRDEISEVRYLLIHRQHSHAQLAQKLEKLEDLGNGLSMHSFETLNADTQGMGKKLEERNVELSRLRMRCNADLHIMAHIKEKSKMMLSNMEIQKRALNQLQGEKYGIRERVYKLKVSRGKTQKEIEELSFQSGLLDKPALMLDYDVTVDAVNQKTNIVRDLRRHLTDLENKVKYLETKC